MKRKHLTAYVESAYAFAKCSDSTRLKVGAVIVKKNRVIGCGYNALPEHMDGPLEDVNGNTLPQVRHAEENALNGLLRSHESPEGATLVVTHSCCPECAIKVVDAGIKTVYYVEEYRLSDGLDILRANGVEVIQYKMEDSQ